MIKSVVPGYCCRSFFASSRHVCTLFDYGACFAFQPTPCLWAVRTLCYLFLTSHYRFGSKVILQQTVRLPEAGFVCFASERLSRLSFKQNSFDQKPLLSADIGISFCESACVRQVEVAPRVCCSQNARRAGIGISVQAGPVARPRILHGTVSVGSLRAWSFCLACLAWLVLP